MNSFGSVATHAGGLGTIIATEMSHAFDLEGRHFGASGETREWWTNDDLASYRELEQELASYCVSKGGDAAGISVADFLADITQASSDHAIDGARLARQAAAVITGLDCASTATQIGAAATIDSDDFDYSDFFSAFASCSRIAEGEDTYQHLLEVDGVLPGFLRTNICVQQVDAFYEACDAAEGDGMYLDEDSRIRIW